MIWDNNANMFDSLLERLAENDDGDRFLYTFSEQRIPQEKTFLLYMT